MYTLGIWISSSSFKPAIAHLMQLKYLQESTRLNQLRSLEFVVLCQYHGLGHSICVVHVAALLRPADTSSRDHVLYLLYDLS